jgi:tetratricopeptide (TPR) repeat protein
MTHPALKLVAQAILIAAVSGETVLAQQTQLTETEAMTAITLATNPSTKLAAAEEFVARFPKSASRRKAAELVAAEILKVRNGTVAIALLERAQMIFTAEDEREIFKPVALEAYATGNRPDDAFKLAAELLAKNPDDLDTLVQMTRAGSEEVKKRNREHNDVALQYGLKAIALIEGGTKAGRSIDLSGAEHSSNLGQLYQQVAILYLGKGDTNEAKARLEKATELRPDDPSNFALLGRVLHADYVKQMDEYEKLPEGKARQERLKQLDLMLDPIVDAYAHAAGLALGRPEYQTLMQQVIPDLTNYYKYRNRKSTKGLQELINKYRLRR